MSDDQRLSRENEELKPCVSLRDAPLEGKSCELFSMEEERYLSKNNCGECEFNGDHGAAETVNDYDVDVIGSQEGVSTSVVKEEAMDADVTEQSSSFGDTFSGSEEGLKINSSDVEVESPLCIETGNQHTFGDPVRLFKKKKVTTHWRKFTSSLVWRCQWLELRMKELQSQAQRYDKELMAYSHEKRLQLKMIDLNDSVSKSVPLTCKSHRKPAMKRGKRRRNEDSINILSYMSSHNIFSYYENKRCETDGHSVDDDLSDQGDDNIRGSEDHLWAIEFRDGDHTIEQALLNIEDLQSRVLKIRANLTQMISANARESTLGCSFMGNQPVSSAQSPSCSLGNAGLQNPAGDSKSHPHPVSEYEMDDNMILPGSAVSSFGDAPDLDIIESTMGLLSGADGSLNPTQLEELYKDTADDVLINNSAADEELQKFEVGYAREKLPKGILNAREPNSDDESTAITVVAESADHGLAGAGATAPRQFSYTGKKRGRKSKRRRRGGSLAGWKIEKLQKKRKLSS